MTYSIVAADTTERVYGVAVASKAMCVGAHVPWGAAGAGALATQAWHDLRYGWEGLALLQQGQSAASTLHELTHGDPDAPNRQLGLIDAEGRIVSYTGSACLPWAGGMCGEHYAVQGNLLAGAQVVEAMAATYEALADLPFVPRLVQALLAGDEAGGDRRGRQSAAVRVWRRDAIPTPDAIDGVADLRIDDAEYPVHLLARMLPKLWLEYGLPDEEHALPLSGVTRDRVREGLAARGFVDSSGDDIEEGLTTWASQLNLESRLIPGRVDPTVLDVLESGAATVLERAAEQVPPRFWPV
jgi:uncharacterized Ntn-hydrolase superfamily protein